MCFGGGKSTTTVVVPPPPEPSKEEVRQNQLTNQLLELNISSQGFDIVEGPDGPRIVERQLTPDQIAQKTQDETRDRELQDRLFQELEGLGERDQEFEDRITALLDPELTDRQRQIQDLAEQRQLEELSGQPSERTKELVGETFESARTMGEEDIQRFATELAGSRGFERTDSPVAQEAFKAQRDLTTGLRSAEAGALLDVGQRNQLFGQSLREFQSGLDFNRFSQTLSAGGFVQGRSLNSLNSILAIQDFQNSLRQQATQNRLNIGGVASNLAGQTGNLRLAGFQPQLVTKKSGGFNIGGVAQGIGAAAGGFIVSSTIFKDNLEALETGDYQDILDSLERTPVYRWTYKPEFNDERRHIGPITEQAPKEIVTEDGMAVVPIDYLGFMMAALKGLQEKVNNLEAKNGSTK